MALVKIDDNIELRLLRPEYSDEIAAVVMDNYAELNKWLPWVNEEYTAATTLKFIKLAEIQYAEKKGLQAAVFVDNSIAGGIGFNNIDGANRTAEIGYWLSRRFTGLGIMTRCCVALVDFGLTEFGLNRIVIRCATENLKSQAIPQRLGFTEEGIQREAEKLHNKYVDLKVFSLLASERDSIDRLV
ncbi:MAG: GNAT family N-acetyltransferase [Acidobacteriota bacterium]|nr:GNAT family N-acetyltransferase [Acidobacteriota bacterium]MDH3530293.1 GNAT family N-acetyltransferase [Acidobacteriota bacterium]